MSIENKQFNETVSSQEKTPFKKELMKYVPIAEKFIEENKGTFKEIANDSSLEYVVSDKGFRIDLEKGLIYLDLHDWQWAEERGLSEDQIKYSVYHEIGHFKDLREDPEGLLGIFDYTENKAKKLAPEVLDIWRKKMPDGKLPEYVDKQIPIKGSDKTISFVENFIRKNLLL
jgi:hypothetical protein